MTAVSAELQSTPLTAADYLALPEDDTFRWELQEGGLVMTPRPGYDHADAGYELANQIRTQLPDQLWGMQDADIDLELTDPAGPGFVRAPDFFVIERAVREEIRRERRIARASEVLLVVEIVSPSSKRTDGLVKRAEYADAGIPHYWIIDPDPPVSLVACHLTEEFGYLDDGAVTGTYVATAPVPLTIGLDKLR
jgi:Uma2 family endonuclease